MSAAVAERLSSLLASGLRLPAERTLALTMLARRLREREPTINAALVELEPRICRRVDDGAEVWTLAPEPTAQAELDIEAPVIRPTQRRAIELVDRLAAFAASDWSRHAEDLRRASTLCRREALPIQAERAAQLAQAAEAQAKRAGSQAARAAPSWCVACGARLVAEAITRRFCGAPCRLRAWRGVWTSPIAAEAAAVGLSVTDLWRTPPELIEALRAELGELVLDAAATARDSVAPRWISPADDALKVSWAGFLPVLDNPQHEWIFCNPPYGGGLLVWMQHAHVGAQETGRRVVVLAPPGIGSRYRAFAEQHGEEIRDLNTGRLAFLHPETGKPAAGGRDGSSLFLYHPLGCRPGGGPARVYGWSWRHGR